MIKDESNGDPAEPKSEGGEGQQPDVAHLKQTPVNKQKQTNKEEKTINDKKLQQKINSLQTNADAGADQPTSKQTSLPVAESALSPLVNSSMRER